MIDEKLKKIKAKEFLDTYENDKGIPITEMIFSFRDHYNAIKFEINDKIEPSSELKLALTNLEQSFLWLREAIGKQYHTDKELGA